MLSNGTSFDGFDWSLTRISRLQYFSMSKISKRCKIWP